MTLIYNWIGKILRETHNGCMCHMTKNPQPLFSMQAHTQTRPWSLSAHVRSSAYATEQLGLHCLTQPRIDLLTPWLINNSSTCWATATLLSRADDWHFTVRHCAHQMRQYDGTQAVSVAPSTVISKEKCFVEFRAHLSTWNYCEQRVFSPTTACSLQQAEKLGPFSTMESYPNIHL